jgi:single stranded DNA-binding protein
MTDINTVTLTGRLVREPQNYKNDTGGFAIFTVASNHGYKDRKGNTQNETAFVNCKVFGAWAAGLEGRQKGEMVIVSGRLKTETWEQDGAKRQQLTLICQTVQVVTRAPQVGLPGTAATESDDESKRDVPF